MSCPKCRCPGGDILPNLTRRCGACGYIYNETLTFPVVPPLRTATAAAGTKQPAVIIIVAAIVILAAAGIAMAVMLDSEPPYAHSDDPSPYRTAANPSAAPGTAPSRMQLEIVHAVYGGELDMSFWYLLEVRNTGDAPVSKPQVNYSEGSNKAYGFSECDSLAPGDSTVFICYWAAPTRKQGAFELSEPKRPSHHTARLAIDELTTLTNESPRGPPNVSVKLRNDKSKAAYSLKVLVIGRDGQGRPVCHARAYTTPGLELKPGETHQTTVYTGVHVAGLVASWEAHAYARLRD
ncbi:MAG: hypothetical protein KF696_10610 [Planctomycetes bacterium]|nr:hypothetical protein [Planctomycetota bacterium]MCW8135119.1 hypothetical protein [Planctomycetota bacterium]